MTEQKHIEILQRVLAPPDSDQLLTIEAAAMLLAVSPATVRAWYSSRRHGITPVHIGRKVRIRLADVRRLVADGMLPKHQRAR